jgi:hypothetical protein
MAYKIVTFYNIEAPVGRNCPNHAEDVALVRFFLHRIGEAPDVNIPTLASLEINTNPGPDLDTAILAFQAEVRKRGGSCAQDGRVDPATGIGQGVKSSITHTGYTIAHLNGTYRRRYTPMHDDLTKDPQCPNILRPKFQSGAFGY